ncbi:hypothetical protein EON80_11820 [bacterium]|nr:MAG: hypothetical protein EON80_11820 [bacterium]
MRRLAILCLPLWTLSLWNSSALAQPYEPPPKRVAPPQAPIPPVMLPRVTRQPRPAEAAAQIRQDIQEFVAAFNGIGRTNFFVMQRWVYGARIGFFGANAWWSEFTKTSPLTLEIDKLDLGAIEGESASATLTYHFQVPPETKGDVAAELKKPLTEVLTLRLGPDPTTATEKVWQIVPPATEEAAHEAAYKAQQFLSFVAYYLAQNGPMKLSRMPLTKADLSMNRMKQLSLGVLMFAQDFDERYAFAPEYLHDAIFPYVKNEDLFLIPGGQDTYTFNPQLSDKKLTDLKELISTVMFYEGENEQPLFRYNGKATIAFADGHVKLVSPEEAKTLKWKP